MLVINLNLLTNVKKLDSPLEIQLFKRKVVIQATHIGDVYLRTNIGCPIILKDVYYTPEGRCNILSILLLQFANINFKIESFTAYLYKIENGSEKTLATGYSTNSILYTFEFEISFALQPSTFALTGISGTKKKN